MKQAQTMELKDRAERLFGAGKFRRSLQLYRELIAREPRDPRLRVRCAELRRRLESREEAAHDYLAAAKLFAAQGYGGRARAALRLAEALAPFDDEVMKANLTGLQVAGPVPHSNVLGAIRPRRIELEGDTDFWASRSELPGMRKALPGREASADSSDPTTRWVQLPEDDEAREAPADLCSEEDFERMYGLAP